MGDLGRAVQAYVAGMIALAFVGGAVAALLGYFLLSWLFAHVEFSIGWV